MSLLWCRGGLSLLFGIEISFLVSRCCTLLFGIEIVFFLGSTCVVFGASTSCTLEVKEDLDTEKKIEKSLYTQNRRRHDRLYLHGPHPRKTMVWNHGLHPLRTMVLKTPALAPGYRKKHRSGCRKGFQDHGSEEVQTMVPDHGFARVGTMQVQAIMPRLTKRHLDTK